MKQKYTPGPWRWELNERSKHINLCGGVPTYDKTVMDFVRWGMGGAMPRFRADYGGFHCVMEKVNTMGIPVPGREHHKGWFQNVNNPDALLISKAPELLEMLQALVNHSDEGYIAVSAEGYEEWENKLSLLLEKSKELIKTATEL